MIRVFPRKTKWTPTDDLAFFEEPPLFELPDVPVRVSVTFTWDKKRGQTLFEAWRKRCKDVSLGGPAFDDPGGEFVPGRFIRDGVTITSRGCPKRCPWCLVHKREGSLREVMIRRGRIVNDNNLLACSDEHVDTVFAMLSHEKTVQFKGGLDIEYLEPWHIVQLKQLSVDEIWVACDSDSGLDRLDKAVDLLSDFSIEKKRCYVMVGFNGETQDEATRRCEAVFDKGFLPFAQLYRGVDSGPVRGDWREFCWYWSSPRYYRRGKTIDINTERNRQRKGLGL